ARHLAREEVGVPGVEIEGRRPTRRPRPERVTNATRLRRERLGPLLIRLEEHSVSSVSRLASRVSRLAPSVVRRTISTTETAEHTERTRLLGPNAGASRTSPGCGGAV